MQPHTKQIGYLISKEIRKCPKCGFYSEGRYCLDDFTELKDVKPELLWIKTNR